MGDALAEPPAFLISEPEMNAQQDAIYLAASYSARALAVRQRSERTPVSCWCRAPGERLVSAW